MRHPYNKRPMMMVTWSDGNFTPGSYLCPLLVTAYPPQVNTILISVIIQINFACSRTSVVESYCLFYCSQIVCVLSRGDTLVITVVCGTPEKFYLTRFYHLKLLKIYSKLFKVIQPESSKFILFQDSFGYSKSYLFSYKIQNISNSIKNNLGILFGVIVNQWISWETF